jgi:hypothetical protein
MGLPLERFTANWGRHWPSLSTYECRLGFGVSLHSGLELRLEVGFWNFYAWVAWNVWVSEKMCQRSNDRWEAENLAGEHGGVVVKQREREAA